MSGEATNTISNEDVNTSEPPGDLRDSLVELVNLLVETSSNSDTESEHNGESNFVDELRIAEFHRCIDNDLELEKIYSCFHDFLILEPEKNMDKFFAIHNQMKKAKQSNLIVDLEEMAISLRKYDFRLTACKMSGSDIAYANDKILTKNGLIFNPIGIGKEKLRDGCFPSFQINGFCDVRLIFSPDNIKIYKFFLPSINLFDGFMKLKKQSGPRKCEICYDRNFRKIHICNSCN